MSPVGDLTLLVPVETPTLVGLLARLDRPAFGRFVADLWTRRGHDARFDGHVVRVAGRRDDGDRVLLTYHGEGGPVGESRDGLPPDVDPDEVVAVVTSDDGSSAARAAAERADATLLGPTDLHRMALYAIDRESCDALFRRHFGRGLEDLGNDRGRGATRWRRWNRRRGGNRGNRRIALPGSSPRVGVRTDRPTAAVLVAAVVVAVLVGVSGSGLAGLSSPVGASADAPDARGAVLTPVVPNGTPTPGPAVVSSLGCQPTPRAGVEAQLSALRTNDPETNDGLRRVWDSATAEFRRYTGPFSTFVTIMYNHPFVGLLDPAAVEYGASTRADGVARQTFTVTSSDGDRYVYAFTFVERDASTDGCWSLTGLTYRSDRNTATPAGSATPGTDTRPAGSDPARERLSYGATDRRAVFTS